MILEYYYSNGINLVNLPDSLDITLLTPKKVKAEDEAYAIRSVLKSPINSTKLSSFISEAQHIVIVVNDHERPTPTAKILSYIHRDVKHKSNRLKFIVASGSHRPPTEAELKSIFGKFYEIYRKSITIHNCRDYSGMEFIGKTVFGTNLFVNKLLTESDKIIVIGSVEPHYFAGFTGGRKFLLPGTSAYESIEQNHRLALHEKAFPLNLDDNPVHQDMVDALNLFDRYHDIFSIMTILNGEHKVLYASAGHINSSFHSCVKVAMDIYSIPIKEKADIVIAIAYPPLDINLYQAHKAIEHAKLALRRDGILILVAACKGGIGPPNFYNLLSSSRDPSEVFEKIKSEYKLGYHKAAKIADLQTWAEIWAVTSMNGRLLENIRIKPFRSLENAIENAIRVKGKDCKVAILDNAALIVPRLT